MVSDSTSDIKVHTLANGMTLVFEAMPWLPSVSFTFLLPVGASTDPSGQEGSASVLNDWMYRGAGELTSQALSDTLDGLGVRRGGGAGKETMSFSASLLSEALPETLNLYADILLRPHLNDEEFSNAKKLAQQELESLADSPTQQLFIKLASQYFASPHGLSGLGSEESLAALTPALLRAQFAERVAPAGAVLSVAGGVSWEALVSQVEALFADWSGTGVPLPGVVLREAHQDHITEETSQVQIGVAFPGVAPGDDVYYTHALALQVLSGGMASRLFTEVREKRNLVYSVAAVARTIRGHGYTLGYAGTTPERAQETMDVLLHELRNIRNGVTAEELERARTGMLSQLVMQGESTGARASALAQDTFLLGKPRTVAWIKEQILSVSLDALNAYLSASAEPDFTILTLGPKPLAEVTSA